MSSQVLKFEKALARRYLWIEKYLDVVEFVILVALESIVHMAHCLARLVPECDKGVLFLCGRLALTESVGNRSHIFSLLLGGYPLIKNVGYYFCFPMT